MLELYLSNSTNSTRGGHSLLLYTGEISGLDLRAGNIMVVLLPLVGLVLPFASGNNSCLSFLRGRGLRMWNDEFLPLSHVWKKIMKSFYLDT